MVPENQGRSGIDEGTGESDLVRGGVVGVFDPSVQGDDDVVAPVLDCPDVIDDGLSLQFGYRNSRRRPEPPARVTEEAEPDPVALDVVFTLGITALILGLLLFVSGLIVNFLVSIIQRRVNENV